MFAAEPGDSKSGSDGGLDHVALSVVAANSELKLYQLVKGLTRAFIRRTGYIKYLLEHVLKATSE